MNEKQILDRCKEFAMLYFHKEFEEKIRISGRMTATSAKVTFKKELVNGKPSYSIVDLAFAKNVFQNSNYPQDELDKIIKHELAHWYIIKFLQMDCGHDAYFKSLCSSIGGDLGYANSQIKTKTEKYAVVCSKCGKLVATRARKPSDKLMFNSISSCCRAQLFDMGKVDLGAMSNTDITSTYLSQYKAAAMKAQDDAVKNIKIVDVEIYNPNFKKKD